MKEDYNMSVIQAKNLTKTYTQGTESIIAVNNVSISIEQGEFVSISGQSGSGKTTLLNLLACIDKPTGGTIVIDGKEVTTAKDDELAKIRRTKVGYIFQDFKLISILSAYENIIMPALLDGRKPDKTYLNELADLLGIADRLKHMPHELSGGQKQRVAIARALINRPSIILADEPTGNLDKKTADEIIHLLQEVNRMGNTLLLVTHEQKYAQLAARRLVIEDGVLSQAK
ncbi:MAG: ABC transporter ATP-binding protein [Oscillospiraceae bacterium]|jgi:putative ABC transport system ATP-binding protein|nr:ABC transporter ATP-binding protein [Oscillospiraceae bacterium]